MIHESRPSTAFAVGNHARRSHRRARVERQTWIAIFLIFAALALTPCTWAQRSSGSERDLWGPRYNPLPSLSEQRLSRGTDAIHHWNEVAINASGLDHTPLAPGESRIFGEQFGPGRASRAMAIVHIAIFEAVNAISGKYHSYVGIRPGIGSYLYESGSGTSRARRAHGFVPFADGKHA